MYRKQPLLPRLYFSYGQFMVYDRNVQLPGCAWTPQHSAQGFARRKSTVNFGTPLEFGYANISVACGAYQSEPYDRVIAVPFFVESGTVIVEGPDEAKPEREIILQPGNYCLIAAQKVIGEEEEAVDLFFESLPKPLKKSTILIADEALNPSMPLIETANIAGEEG